MFCVNRHRLSVAVIVGIVMVSVHSGSQADSHWTRRNQQRAHMFQDSRARAVGDLLTVMISESTQIGNKEDTALNKTGTTDAAFDLASASGGGFGEQGASASLDATGETGRGFTGRATYNDSRRFVDHITVTVVDVLPNGNLVVAGKRCMTISGEQRTLNVSGIVRAIDIGPDNKINSQYIADFQTIYTGEGVSKRFTKQGWMSRTINKVWPF
ncbi:MAG: flagellar basal body L-ring protein FlgH [Planctomycetaceae bacterium]|nr:flagellar basal body L-ring protein FlgH [Planctomycetaceae bacterium]